MYRLEPTSKAIASKRRDLVKQYEAAEAIQIPAVNIKIKARLSNEVPSAPPVSSTKSAAVGSSITGAISTTEVSQPHGDSLQTHSAPDRMDAEMTPQPLEASPAELPAAKPGMGPTRSAPEASSEALAEGVVQPVVAGQVQANGTSHEVKESPKPGSGTLQGSELQGGFLGSALAGKSGKATPTAAQPAASAQAGQQTPSAASCTQHGSVAAETKPTLQGGFLGKALSGKSRTDNAGTFGDTDKHAAQGEANQATSQVPSHEAVDTGAAAQASTHNDVDDAALGSLATPKAEAALVPSPVHEIVADAPPEKSTAAALQVAHRALADKPVSLRPPTSGNAACSIVL